MAPVRTHPKDVDDREVAPTFQVVAGFDGKRVVIERGLSETEARAYADAMNRVEPEWRAIVRRA